MKNRVRFFFLFLGLLGALAVHAQINELPRSTPEAEGVPSKAVTALFDSLMALPKTDIHSVVVLRHGKVIGEIYPAPFAPEYRHTMYSCSKTFVGAAVGLAIADNRLRLTDRVAAFFPELLPDSVSANLADMTVRDLLTMTSGITPDWNMRNLTSDWIRTFLAKPVKTPGKKFEYDSISTYMLCAEGDGHDLAGLSEAEAFHPDAYHGRCVGDKPRRHQYRWLGTAYPERVIGKIRIAAAEPGCLGRQAVASGFLGGADDDQTDRRLWLSDVALRISGCCTC